MAAAAALETGVLARRLPVADDDAVITVHGLRAFDLRVAAVRIFAVARNGAVFVRVRALDGVVVLARA